MDAEKAAEWRDIPGHWLWRDHRGLGRAAGKVVKAVDLNPLISARREGAFVRLSSRTRLKTEDLEEGERELKIDWKAFEARVPALRGPLLGRDERLLVDFDAKRFKALHTYLGLGAEDGWALGHTDLEH